LSEVIARSSWATTASPGTRLLVSMLVLALARRRCCGWATCWRSGRPAS
jgi:hypothetical protein